MVVRRRWGCLLALGAVTVPGAGCYRYDAVEALAHPAVGDGVQLEVTREGADSLGDLVGPGTHFIRGTLLDTTGQRFLLAVHRVETRQGEVAHWAGEAVSIPLDEVQQLTQRRFAAVPSVLLAAAATTGALLVRAAFLHGATVTTGGHGPPGATPH